MQKTLKSNWMNHSDAAPKTFRAASNGKIFTRTERIKIVQNEKARQEAKNARQEMILQAKAKVREESEKRNKFFQSLHILSDNPTAKIRRGKDGLFVQPRVKGAFGPKIPLS